MWGGSEDFQGRFRAHEEVVLRREREGDVPELKRQLGVEVPWARDAEMGSQDAEWVGGWVGGCAAPRLSCPTPGPS